MFGGAFIAVYQACQLFGTLLLQFGMGDNSTRIFTALFYIPGAVGITVFMWPQARFLASAYLGLVSLGTVIYIEEVLGAGGVIRDYATKAMPARPSQIVFPISMMFLAAAIYRTHFVHILVSLLVLADAIVWLSLAPFAQQPWMLGKLVILEDVLSLFAGAAVAISFMWLGWESSNQANDGA